jgi:hypothetical protein
METKLKFEKEKKCILYKIERYANKIKLTNNYINTFNHIVNFDKFNDYCKKYNSLINKCFILKKQLSKLTKWGYIFNTKNRWNSKLNSIEELFALYSDNIMKIYTMNFKYRTSYVVDENSVSHQIKIYEKLKKYLKTYKLNGEYVYIEGNVYIPLNNEFLLNKIEILF